MKRKLCEVCHKKPIAYITRKDEDSPKLYICKDCAPRYLTWGIVSYNPREL